MTSDDKRIKRQHRPTRRLVAGGEQGTAPGGPEPWVQLATRIPQTIRRKLRIHCVRTEIPLMHFVVEALTEKLRRDETGRRQR